MEAGPSLLSAGRCGQVMIVMCAWHKRNFGHAKIIRIVDDGNNIVSDGMCEDCQKIWLAEVEEYQKKEGENEKRRNQRIGCSISKSSK